MLRHDVIMSWGFGGEGSNYRDVSEIQTDWTELVINYNNNSNCVPTLVL